MKARNPSTGNLEEVYVKALDSLPVGTELDFNGSVSDIPIGWEQVETYSTDEVKTGDTWIDGKPIYRKVFTLTTPILLNASWQNVVDISGMNIEAITDLRTLSNNDIAWNGTISKISNNNLQLYYIGVGGAEWYVKTIILEYTKSN